VTIEFQNREVLHLRDDVTHIVILTTLLSIAALLVLILSCSEISSADAVDFSDGVLNYRSEDGTNASVVGHTATEVDVVIPSQVEYDGDIYRVISIGDNAFANSYIESVVIPSSIFEIGDKAFYMCDFLAIVTFAEGLLTVGQLAFFHDDLLQTVILPDSVTAVKNYAFAYCSGVIALTIGSNLSKIGYYAFSYMTNLTEITYSAETCNDIQPDACAFIQAGRNTSGTILTITDGVIHIPSYLFYGYSTEYSPNISQVAIGKDVKSIGERSFSKLYYLQHVEFDAIDCADVSSESFCFLNSGMSVTGFEVIFSDSCKYVPSYLFWSPSEGSTKITDVVIGPNVISIGHEVFTNCSINTITMGDSVESIGHLPFRSTAYKYIHYSENLTSVTNLDYYTYYDTDGLTELTKNVENLSGSTFIKSGSKLIRAVIITFESNGGSSVAKLEGIAGSTCSEPQGPTKECATFAGWYADLELETSYEFGVFPSADLVVYAKWISNHNVVEHSAHSSTCTSNGNTLYYECLDCNTYYSDNECTVQIVSGSWGLPLAPHASVTDAAVPPTCTTSGLTAGSHCSVCNEVLNPQTVVPATGHTPETIPTVPATCTVNGSTGGSRCSVCETVLVTPSIVPATGHNFIHHEGKKPTDTEPGWDSYDECTLCDYSTFVELPIIPDVSDNGGFNRSLIPLIGCSMFIMLSIVGIFIIRRKS